MRKFALTAVFLAALSLSASGHRSYVLMDGDMTMVSGGSLDITSAVAKRQTYGSDFMWVRIDGREYVIRDATTLARIDSLFAPARASDPDMERLHKRMRPIEKRERQLEREADALSDREDDDAALTPAEKARLQTLNRQLRDVESQLRVLEREEDALDKKRDAHEAEAERQMWPLVEEAIRSGVARAE